MIRHLSWLMAAVTILAIGACTAKPIPESIDQRDIDRLAHEIRSLGPDVDAAEAARAAEIAYRYPLQLAKEYGITDPPLVHNAKVNNGLRERGLCNHWTEDMNRRLKQERFDTLTVHWAISPPTPFRIIHHSVIISARGDTIQDGIVLDPWRNGGALFWARTPVDDHYNWRPRMEVREEFLRARAR